MFPATTKDRFGVSRYIQQWSYFRKTSVSITALLGRHYIHLLVATAERRMARLRQKKLDPSGTIPFPMPTAGVYSPARVNEIGVKEVSEK